MMLSKCLTSEVLKLHYGEEQLSLVIYENAAYVFVYKLLLVKLFLLCSKAIFAFEELNTIHFGRMQIIFKTLTGIIATN